VAVRRERSRQPLSVVLSVTGQSPVAAGGQFLVAVDYAAASGIFLTQSEDPADFAGEKLVQSLTRTS
jgi:hypothetical protein